jgi:hypothetical protein
VKNTDNLTGSANTAVSTQTPTPTPTVQITQFTAQPAAIQGGGNSTLTWVLQNATSATIDNGIGSVDPRSGSISVTPNTTTTYTLTAQGQGGPVTAKATVTVSSTPFGPPQIVRFEASPTNIRPGDTSTLSWSTNNACTTTITPTVGSVTPNGSTTVKPQQTTTYTLTVVGCDTAKTTVTAPVTVTVSTIGIPQILTFVANPPTINIGESTKLCWQVSGADNIKIDPGVGSNLNATDCATVSPQTTTTYTLTATNTAGSIQANVTVNVGQTRILSFNANPETTTAAGNPSVLMWQTEHALSVVLVGPELRAPLSFTGAQADSGQFTVNPITNTTYTLTAYGPGGQTVSVSITVFVR